MRIIFNYAMAAIYMVLGLYLVIWGWARLDTLQNKGLGKKMVEEAVKFAEENNLLIDALKAYKN